MCACVVVACYKLVWLEQNKACAVLCAVRGVTWCVIMSAECRENAC